MEVFTEGPEFSTETTGRSGCSFFHDGEAEGGLLDTLTELTVM